MKRIIHSVFILFLSIVFYSHLSQGQLSDIKFRHLDVHNGLPSNIVTSIVKDSLGYMWVGTKKGLCRYDGIQFFIYTHDYNDSNSLPGNEIYSLLLAKRNELWVATNKGICRYNYRANKFYKLQIPLSFLQKNNSVSKIFLQDKNGYIWFYEYACKSLIAYNPETKDYKTLDFFVNDRSDPVYSMFEDASGDFWISRLEYFYHYYSKTGTFEKIRNPRRANDPPDPFIITRFCQGENGNLWMTSWGAGLEHYNTATHKTDHYLIDTVAKLTGTTNVLDYPKWIKDRNNGKTLLWITTHGLSSFDTATGKFTSYEPDIYNPYSSKLVYAVSSFPGSYYDDEQNILWCWGPFGIDICDLNCQTIQTFHTVSERNKVFTGSANGFINNQLRPNEYFLSNFIANSIFIYDEAKNSIREHPIPLIKNGISRLFQPDGATVWLSVEADIWEWNQVTNKVKNITSDLGKDHDQLAKNATVCSYFKDSKNIIWLGTNGGGLCRFDRLARKYQWRNRVGGAGATSIPSPECIIAFADAENGDIYALDRTKGLFKIDRDGQIADLFTPNPFVSATSHRKSPVSKFFSMAYDKKNQLWICSDEGLISFDTKTGSFSAHTENDNLPAACPTRIAIDRHGYIWLSYVSSLVVFDPSQNKSRLFNYKNGFESSPDDCHLIINNSGDLRIAYENHIESTNGDPFAFARDTMPSVLVTMVQSGNKIINIFDSSGRPNNIDVDYNNNNLSIDFALPLFHNPDDIVYYYMLRGFDNTWLNARNSHVARYTNLPGGNYNFMVKAFDPLSGRYSPVTSVLVIAHPPFWKTWWFTILAIVAIASGIYALYRYRLEQLLRLEKMRTSISSDLHDEVGATLSSISIYSNVAKKMADLDRGRSKEYLDKIETSSLEMIDSMSDIVWSINPANDDPGKMIQRMRTYAYEVLGAADIELHWKEDEQVEKQKMTMEQRKNFYLFFKEGINNAAKYSKAKALFVDLNCSRQHVSLRIKDNGIGFNTQERGNGNGLRNMQLRSKILKGQFQVTSSENTGTELVLTFPV